MATANFGRNFAAVKHSSLTLLATIVLFVLSVCSAPAAAQLVPDTVSYACGAHHTVDVGEALQDSASILDTIFVKVSDTTLTFLTYTSNPKNSKLRISPDSGTMNINTTTHLAFFIAVFQPDSIRNYTTTIVLNSQQGKCPDTLIVTARGIDTTSETDSIPLLSNISRSIAFISSADTTERLVRLHNNTAQAIKISEIHMARGTSFLVAPQSSLPLSLAPDSILNVTLTFHNPQQGQNNDYLIVSMPDEGILLDVIPIQGFYEPPPAAVRYSQSMATRIAIFPNPSIGGITVHSATGSRSHATITDLLGRRMKEASFNDDWQWDRETTTGATAMAGTYFVIVSGTTERGESFREVQTIVLE